MKKKILVILISLMLAALPLLAGCSQGGTGDGNDSGTEQYDSQHSHDDDYDDDDDDDEDESEHHSSTTAKISREKAVSIVLGRVDGARESDIRELETDSDDGRFVYEGELVYNGYEYEFEIDGETGDIISWEIDRE